MVLRTGFDDEQNGATKLKHIIDRQTIAANEEKRSARGSKARSMYASDYGQCLRKTWYGFFPDEYPSEELGPRTLRIFQNGDDVHNRLGSYLARELDIDFHEEVDVPRDELQVHGRCDGICRIDGRGTVVEFKSINQASVRKAKEEHTGQLMWYLEMWKMQRRLLKEDFGFKEGDILCEKDLIGVESASGRVLEELNEAERWMMLTQGEFVGEVIYESKQTNATFHFPVEYDPELARKVRLWFTQLKWHVERKELPRVAYDRTKFPCSWGEGASFGKCQYFDQCWSGKKC